MTFSSTKKSSWKNRWALISGASSGLGCHLARQLAIEQANVILIGRQQDRLDRLRSECIELGAHSAVSISLDVCDKTSRWSELKSILDSQGCDLLINAIGKSDRGELSQLTDDDLRSLVEVNVIATHRMTNFCWDALQQSKGVVVNIASLAGIVPGPSMGGYSLAKHALVGMHRQWRIEAKSQGIHFLLVCPGPIERDDSQDRYSELASSRGLDPQTAKPGGGVSLKRLDPKELSVSILRSAANRELELIRPAKARLLAALLALWPSFADNILIKKLNR